ncbi:DUF3087 family protein [Agarivorans aestuarii]|uniref:DUF3087 family protein n=1 Tax=Agarivorans aestuarii TaxID=1563703 RepID=A0ABU7FZL2_9ALTE|nr:DUF3087 family protein [Agarivorans aestuarii]MEE1672339.1 DUF3087 family protein [Agarivorans aestuarii]
MQFQNIDKAVYQQRSRYTYIGISGLLIVFTLLWSSLFIAVFSSGPDNFYLNLLGVVAAVISVVPVVLTLKNKPWFYEVMYVWRLKQELNKINRKMATLVKAMNTGDVTAFEIVKFSYLGSRQIWELDDNTLMLNELAISENKLEQQAEQFNLGIDANNYTTSALQNY